MKVSVYRNLTKDCWSVVDNSPGETRGRVIAHSNELFLGYVSFRVNEAGRLRVLQEKRKNVHARGFGELIYISRHDTVERYPDIIFPYGYDTSISTPYEQISYNPYRGPYFYRKRDNEPMFYADVAHFAKDGKMYSEGERQSI